MCRGNRDRRTTRAQLQGVPAAVNVFIKNAIAAVKEKGRYLLCVHVGRRGYEKNQVFQPILILENNQTYRARNLRSIQILYIQSILEASRVIFMAARVEYRSLLLLLHFVRLSLTARA